MYQNIYFSITEYKHEKQASLTASNTFVLKKETGGSPAMKMNNIEKNDLEKMERSLNKLKLLEDIKKEPSSDDPLLILTGRNPYFTVQTYSCKE